MFANKYIIAILVPILLSVCSAVAKKLVRGSPWQRTDFFFGIDLSLASLAAALVNIFDVQSSKKYLELLRRLDKVGAENYPEIIAQKTNATACFIVVCFFLLLWIMSTHQDWEKRTQDKVAQILWLGVVSNIVGFGLMFTFILLVKGIDV